MTINLLCIKDVQMRISNQIAFNAGRVYAFTLEADGSLSRYSVETGYHSFSAKNWGEWFCYVDTKHTYELVQESV